MTVHLSADHVVGGHEEPSASAAASARGRVRVIVLRDGGAIASACRSAGGDEGAALAWALIDMAGDDDTLLRALPLGEMAALLGEIPARRGDRARAALARLISAVEDAADEEFLAAEDYEREEGRRGSARAAA